MQVNGKVIGGEDGMFPLPPEPTAPVDVFFYLNTHFGDLKICLQKEPYEEDAQVLKGRLASGAVEYQLQRAILSAATCLMSGMKKTEGDEAEVSAAEEQTAEEKRAEEKRAKEKLAEEEKTREKGHEILDAIDKLERYDDLLVSMHILKVAHPVLRPHQRAD